MKAISALDRIALLRHEHCRAAALRAWRAAKRQRRLLAERRGSDRYSRPAVNDLDRRLEPYLGNDGVFVEAGANDGYRASNTYYLERFRGWRGVLIEPIPTLARRAMKERRRSHVVNAALVADDHRSPTIEVRYGGLFSATAGTSDFDDGSLGEAHDVPSYIVTVPARTLSSVLDELDITRIDFLSLDVQGLEEQALRGLDFTRLAPHLALIEIVDASDRPAIEMALGPRYSLVDQLTGYDYLYRLTQD